MGQCIHKYFAVSPDCPKQLEIVTECSKQLEIVTKSPKQTDIVTESHNLRLVSKNTSPKSFRVSGHHPFNVSKSAERELPVWFRNSPSFHQSHMTIVTNSWKTIVEKGNTIIFYDKFFINLFKIIPLAELKFSCIQKKASLISLIMSLSVITPHKLSQTEFSLSVVQQTRDLNIRFFLFVKIMESVVLTLYQIEPLYFNALHQHAWFTLFSVVIDTVLPHETDEYLWHHQSY
jgi:hypothetical protein